MATLRLTINCFSWKDSFSSEPSARLNRAFTQLLSRYPLLQPALIPSIDSVTQLAEQTQFSCLAIISTHVATISRHVAAIARRVAAVARHVAAVARRVATVVRHENLTHPTSKTVFLYVAAVARQVFNDRPGKN